MSDDNLTHGSEPWAPPPTKEGAGGSCKWVFKSRKWWVQMYDHYWLTWFCWLWIYTIVRCIYTSGLVSVYFSLFGRKVSSWRETCWVFDWNLLVFMMELLLYDQLYILWWTMFSCVWGSPESFFFLYFFIFFIFCYKDYE